MTDPKYRLSKLDVVEISIVPSGDDPTAKHVLLKADPVEKTRRTPHGFGSNWHARDGDGDGFIHDGTPMQRPVTPRLRVPNTPEEWDRWRSESKTEDERQEMMDMVWPRGAAAKLLRDFSDELAYAGARMHGWTPAVYGNKLTMKRGGQTIIYADGKWHIGGKSYLGHEMKSVIGKSMPTGRDLYVETPLQRRKRKKRHQAVMEKAGRVRDGDGDGFVHDGTPMQRPVTPKIGMPLRRLGPTTEVIRRRRAALGGKVGTRSGRNIGSSTELTRRRRPRPKNLAPDDTVLKPQYRGTPATRRRDSPTMQLKGLASALYIGAVMDDEQSGRGQWIRDPEFSDVFGFEVDGKIGVVLYSDRDDFEMADWYEDDIHSRPKKTKPRKR